MCGIIEKVSNLTILTGIKFQNFWNYALIQIFLTTPLELLVLSGATENHWNEASMSVLLVHSWKKLIWTSWTSCLIDGHLIILKDCMTDSTKPSVAWFIDFHVAFYHIYSLESHTVGMLVYCNWIMKQQFSPSWCFLPWKVPCFYWLQFLLASGLLIQTISSKVSQEGTSILQMNIHNLSGVKTIFFKKWKDSSWIDIQAWMIEMSTP